MTLFTVNRGRREKCARGTFPHLRTAVISMAAYVGAADNMAAGPAAPANARQQRGRTALIWRCNPHDEEEHPLDMLPRAASAYQLAYAPPEKLFSEGHTLPGYPYGSLEEVDVNVALAETPALREALADLEAGAGDARPLALPGPMMLLSSLVDPAAVYRARRGTRMRARAGRPLVSAHPSQHDLGARLSAHVRRIALRKRGLRPSSPPLTRRSSRERWPA